MWHYYFMAHLPPIIIVTLGISLDLSCSWDIIISNSSSISMICRKNTLSVHLSMVDLTYSYISWPNLSFGLFLMLLGSMPQIFTDTNYGLGIAKEDSYFQSVLLTYFCILRCNLMLFVAPKYITQCLPIQGTCDPKQEQGQREGRGCHCAPRGEVRLWSQPLGVQTRVLRNSDRLETKCVNTHTFPPETELVLNHKSLEDRCHTCHCRYLWVLKEWLSPSSGTTY